MTKKEYATKEELEKVDKYSTLFTFLVLLLSVLIAWALSLHNPTLTQLAEAEGWEVVCIEWVDVSDNITDYPETELCSNMEGKLPVCKSFPNECITYALRKATNHDH